MPLPGSLWRRLLDAAYDEPERGFPGFEEIVVAEAGLEIPVVDDVVAGVLALHPIVAPAETIVAGDDVHVVRPARGPIVAGALAIIVLPGRTESLAQFSRFREDLREKRKPL